MNPVISIQIKRTDQYSSNNQSKLNLIFFIYVCLRNAKFRLSMTVQSLVDTGCKLITDTVTVVSLL